MIEGEKIRRENAEAIWADWQKYENARRLPPAMKPAFVRLFVLTGWEDLSWTLAPDLHGPGVDPESMTDRQLEAFIDAHQRRLLEGVASGAREMMAENGWGWREMARMFRARHLRGDDE